MIARCVLGPIVIFGFLIAAEGAANAKMTTKCHGQTWETIATETYGNPRLGPLLAYLNRKAGETNCPKGRFVRLLGTIKHRVRPGQTLKKIAERFLRGKGARRYLQKTNELKKSAKLKASSLILIPTEIALKVSDIGLVEDLISLKDLFAYNGVSSLKSLLRLRLVYVPIAPTRKAPNIPRQVSVSEGSKTDPVDKDLEPKPAEPEARPPPTKSEKPEPSLAIVHESKVNVPKLAQTKEALDITASLSEFTHASHIAVMGAGRQCGNCHIEDPARGETYFNVPKEVCAQCHGPDFVNDSEMRINRLPLEYSHKLHLDPDDTVAKDYTTACALCHRPEKEGKRSLPGHETCDKCHNATENKLTVAEHCEGCHGETEQFDRDFSAKLLLADHLKNSVRGNNLIFEHENHVVDLTSKGLAADAVCEHCHIDIRQTESIEEIEPPRMSDCLSCHKGLGKVAKDTIRALDRCQTCHVEQATSVRPTLSSVREKPLSHTSFFRKNHRVMAERDEKVCQACHTSLAGGKASNCDRCHSQMRPSDHTARFREHPHGRAAVRQPDRCATCHQIDRCSECHNMRPASHFPKEQFRRSGHGRAARFSTRQCFVCHQVETECARCHSVNQ